MRFLSVWFPNWSITAAGHCLDDSVAVVESGRVLHCSPGAYRDGVRIGQRRREAKSNSPEMAVLAPNPQLDATQFEPIIAALTSVVARLEVTEPGLCTLAADGPTRYYGGESALVHELQEVLCEPGIPPARIGIADSRFAAKLAARTGSDGHLVPVGSTKDFLSNFPITTLELDELSTLSQRLGIHTLGQFADLPTRSVLSRFGSAAATAHALARGLNPEPLAVHQPNDELAVSVELDPPAERVDIATFAAKQLSTQFMEMLVRRGLACTQLRIEAQTEHAEETSRIWRATTVFDSDTVVERVRWQLSGWLEASGAGEIKPTAGICLLRLVADEVAGSADLQISLWGEMSQVDRRAIRGLDRVRGLLGSSAIFTALIGGGRSPADRVTLVPWGQPPPTLDPPMPWPGQVPNPLPAVVHNTPLPIEVHCDDGPVQVTVRGEVTGSPQRLRLPDGRWRRIDAWAGPWLVDEQWWEPESHCRVARFQILSTDVAVGEGNQQTVHLCLVQQNAWWIEATYD